MKSLKFRRTLADQILAGEKTTTWRLFDDKDISKGDLISFFIWETGERFARVKVINIKEKKIKYLDEKDWEGHEKFSSEEEMYNTYSKYYKMQVTPETKLKIIKYELIK